MSAHTEGPWEARILEPGRTALIVGLDSIAGMQNSGDYTADEFEANARLIAGAPETAAERDRLKAITAEIGAALAAVSRAIESALPYIDDPTARAVLKMARQSAIDALTLAETEARHAIAEARKP